MQGRIVVTAALLTGMVLPGHLRAQEANPEVFVGAWRQVSVTYPDTATGQRATAALQTGYLRFLPRHFSMVRITGAPPRVRLTGADAATATADDLRAAWGPFIGNAGTWEVRADTVYSFTSVCKIGCSLNPNGWFSDLYRMSGDSLWLSPEATSRGGSRSENARGTEILYVREEG